MPQNTEEQALRDSQHKVGFGDRLSGLKTTDWLAVIALTISSLSLLLSYISSYYISNADISKFRLEKSLDYCQKIAFGENMSAINAKMREAGLFEKARGRRLTPDDSRLIGDYLNTLEYAAIFVSATKLAEDEQARDLFVSCTCDLFYNAKHYYIRGVSDQSQYVKLNSLVNINDFWTRTEPCKTLWQRQP